MALEAMITVSVLWFQWKATERRAHDLNTPAWPFGAYAALTIGLVMIRVVGQLYGWLSLTNVWWLLGAQAAAFVGLVIVFGVRAGDRKANAWGNPPKPFFDFTSPKPDNYRPPRI